MLVVASALEPLSAIAVALPELTLPPLVSLTVASAVLLLSAIAVAWVVSVVPPELLTADAVLLLVASASAPLVGLVEKLSADALLVSSAEQVAP